MRDSDVFLVASITKVFVATAVFILVQDGKLRLNDNVGLAVTRCACWSICQLQVFARFRLATSTTFGSLMIIATESLSSAK
jgi:hypothetical protein